MGTHYAGDSREVAALNAYIKLQRAADTLRARLHPTMASHGLTETQFAILEALMHLGPLAQRELGSKLLVSGANITFVVDNLERDGLVLRERCPHDRRRVTVSLTEAGRARISSIFPAHVVEIVKLFSELEVEEQNTLGALCKKLGRSAVADRPKGA